MHSCRPGHFVAILVACITGCGEDSTTGPSPDPNPAVVLALGGRHACYADESSTWCWGAGSEGQLGTGLTPADAVPTQLPGAPAFVLLVGGLSHTCGLDEEGKAYCWGSNVDGQLGTRSELEQCPLPCATTPRPVAGDLRFSTLAAGTRHTCGITTAGAAFCWGLNSLGQLGISAAGESCPDGACFRVPTAVQSTHSFTAITAALNHSCALDQGGAAFCWGFHAGTSEGGNRNPQYRPEVRPVEGGIAFRQISAGGWHTCGVTAAGTAYCWGIDAIGAGPSPLEADAPVPVGGEHHFEVIYSGGSTSCGIDEDGVAYCWGPNTSGAVGAEPVGSTVRFDLPTQVSGGYNFTALAPGQGTYCGATTNEAIVCWGRGSSGELGAGHEDSSIPIPVPGL